MPPPKRRSKKTAIQIYFLEDFLEATESVFCIASVDGIILSPCLRPWQNVVLIVQAVCLSHLS